MTEGKLTTASICSSFRETISDFQAAAVSRVNSAKGKASDPYVAAAFRANNAWVRDPMDKRFAESMMAQATAALNAVSDGQAGTVSDVEVYLADALKACGLATSHSEAASSVAAAVAAGKRVVTAAKNKPWYPRGYEEWVDGVAFKFNRSATNSSYLFGWAYNVITRDGCPGGLYVEVNFTNGGTVVDYGNDLVRSLKPRQRALLQLRSGTSSKGIDSFDVNEVTCY